MSIIPLRYQPREVVDLIRAMTHLVDEDMAHLGPSWGMGAGMGMNRCPVVPRSMLDECLNCGTVSKTTGDFHVNINVKEYAPEELKITTEGNMLVIEGKHEKNLDGKGLVLSHFVRKYRVPEGHHIEGAVSNLSKNGILTITAPMKGELKTGPTAIPISHGGQENGKMIK